MVRVMKPRVFKSGEKWFVFYDGTLSNGYTQRMACMVARLCR